MKNLRDLRLETITSLEGRHSKAVNLFEKENNKGNFSLSRLKTLNRLICSYANYINHFQKLIKNDPTTI